MKKLLSVFIISLMVSAGIFAIPPFYSLGSKSGDILELAESVNSKLATEGFDILGEYHPGNDKSLYVIVFSSKALISSASRVKDRGLLGGVLRVGLVSSGNQVKLSMLNPDYMFNAYFRTAMSDASLSSALNEVSKQAKDALKTLNGTLSGFGGDVSEKELQKYHYMMGMPYFTDPVKLAEFSSFEEGVKIISANLKAGKGSTVKVYENIITGKKVAVFGVGLLDTGTGEANFLSIIGTDHVAAMPYEIILMDNEASMLHGRFRFALYWPELTMGTFTKIMSTPGDVEESLKGLCIK
ncbi:MAG: hypothetical protein K9H49_06475 [Bacteroidales bacterium]|nr:hypothetical protein [Bacteroidales bacterium]MCF8389319.1 hypothetical protein [Bacteroidales bacterium]